MIVHESRRPVAEIAERDVMACIGCNDCMLACPLPQSSEVMIAELNAAVHLPVITSPAVIDFVSACTQCRQCVPACPADLSRADMVLYNKMKVEDTIPNYTLLLQVREQVTPSPWTLDDLTQKLLDVALFKSVDFADLRHLLLKVTLRQLAPGEVLCREGEFFDRLFIVIYGSLEQTQAGWRGERIHVLVLGPGSFFGEMAVLADQPEAYTVHAREPSVVIEVPKAAVRRLMDTSPVFQARMDELYRSRALWTYARMPHVLGGLPEAALEEVFRAAELRPLKAGETVIREGTRPSDAFVVRSGFLRVSAKSGDTERVLVYFREGDVFGAFALLANEPSHPYTVQATGRAEVVRIPGPHLFQVLSRYPQARTALEAGALQVEHTVRATIAYGPAPAGGKRDATRVAMSMEVLVEKGLAAGNEVLVVDQNICTNCQSCVDACGRRHKYGRLQLRGLQVENLLFPTACRHCEDPVCLLCSVNGIVRLPSGEITIVDDNCIGCGACAQRCPYGNISMHPVDPPKEGFLFRLMDLLRGGRDRERAMKDLEPSVARKAVKCDLCAGYDDYACVTACPVGAAFRVDPMKALQQDELLVGLEMRRRGA